MKCFITGASGFIGSNLTHLLSNYGFSLICNISKDEQVLQTTENIKTIQKDILTIKPYDIEDCDCIIHLAANNDTQSKNKNIFKETNLNGSLNMLSIFDNSKYCKKFIYASSTAVYGDLPTPFYEEKCNPITDYAKSKFLFDEHILKRNNEKDVIGLRFSNIYGPGESHKGHRKSMIGQMIEKALENKNINLFKFGQQKRDWYYVKDLVNLIHEIITSNHFNCSNVFNTASGENISFNDIFEIIKTKTNTKSEIVYIDNPFTGTYQDETLCSVDKIKNFASYETKFFIEKGIEDYIKFLS